VVSVKSVRTSDIRTETLCYEHVANTAYRYLTPAIHMAFVCPMVPRAWHYLRRMSAPVPQLLNLVSGAKLSVPVSKSYSAQKALIEFDMSLRLPASEYRSKYCSRHNPHSRKEVPNCDLRKGNVHVSFRIGLAGGQLNMARWSSSRLLVLRM
jgi:hypothetical protein